MTRTRTRPALALLALLGWAVPGLAAAAGPPPWEATLRAGAFVLYSPGVPGHPVGPDLELSVGRSIYDLVTVEVNAGWYTASLTGTGTQLTVVPLTVSLKLLAAPEHGFEAYAVAGLGANLTRLSGGAVADTPTTTVAFHAGLGVRRRLGEAVFAGLDARYAFQDAASPLGRLDGLRLSLLAGTHF
jgi:hypothetical protein